MGVIKNNDLTVLMTPLVAIIYIYIYIYHAISYLDNAPRPREYREIIQLSAYRKSRNLRAFIYIHVTGHTQRRRPRLSSSRVVEH